jgi:hypothetical protein
VGDGEHCDQFLGQLWHDALKQAPLHHFASDAILSASKARARHTACDIAVTARIKPDWQIVSVRQ